jgi:hypothetical protein
MMLQRMNWKLSLRLVIAFVAGLAIYSCWQKYQMNVNGHADESIYR